MQAVLVTNQVYAGSLGADALAAAAIGFTVSILSCPSFLLHGFSMRLSHDTYSQHLCGPHAAL